MRLSKKEWADWYVEPWCLVAKDAERQGVYPEGIDVLAKTDFYSVSVRRIAFTTAAVSVAV